MSASEYPTRRARIISAPSDVAQSHGTKPGEEADALERLRRLSEAAGPDPQADVFRARYDESEETAQQPASLESPAPSPAEAAPIASFLERLDRLKRLGESTRTPLAADALEGPAPFDEPEAARTQTGAHPTQRDAPAETAPETLAETLERLAKFNEQHPVQCDEQSDATAETQAREHSPQPEEPVRSDREDEVDALESLRRSNASGDTAREADVLEPAEQPDGSAQTARETGWAREADAVGHQPQPDVFAEPAPEATASEDLQSLDEAAPEEEALEPKVQLDQQEAAASEAEALERLARLNKNLRTRTFPDARPVGPQPAKPATDVARQRRIRGFLPSGRVIKSILAVAVAIALAWVPVNRLLSTSSAEATINARLINLRAPIDGTVSVVVPTIAVGTLVKPGELLLQLTNTRADRKRLDDLRHKVSELRSESNALQKQREKLQAISNDLRTQSDAFQEGRIRQLEARVAEYTAEVSSTNAQLEDAEKSLNRSKDLKERGYQTLATLLHAERDFKVAGEKTTAARHRLESAKIELEGARKGLFVGDSYNDLPRSAQRVTEVDQQVAHLTSQLDERQGRMTYLDKEVIKETENLESNSVAKVTATVQGRIWETLTANGEEVQAGQELLRVLDCAGAVITATVSESIYNKLWVGQPAKFKLRGMSEEYSGSIAGLTGLTAAGSNFAINQSALTREPYHVTIAVPKLAARQECNVGRTGRVTFDTSSGSGPGLAAAARNVIRTVKPALNLP